jgi:hypothetical protein
VGQIMRAQNFETVFGMQTSGRRWKFTLWRWPHDLWEFKLISIIVNHWRSNLQFILYWTWRRTSCCVVECSKARAPRFALTDIYRIYPMKANSLKKRSWMVSKPLECDKIMISTSCSGYGGLGTTWTRKAIFWLITWSHISEL